MTTNTLHERIVVIPRKFGQIPGDDRTHPQFASSQDDLCELPPRVLCSGKELVVIIDHHQEMRPHSTILMNVKSVGISFISTLYRLSPTFDFLYQLGKRLFETRDGANIGNQMRKTTKSHHCPTVEVRNNQLYVFWRKLLN